MEEQPKVQPDPGEKAPEVPAAEAAAAGEMAVGATVDKPEIQGELERHPEEPAETTVKVDKPTIRLGIKTHKTREELIWSLTDPESRTKKAVALMRQRRAASLSRHGKDKAQS